MPGSSHTSTDTLEHPAGTLPHAMPPNKSKQSRSQQKGSPESGSQLAGPVQAHSVHQRPGASLPQLGRGGHGPLHPLHSHPGPQLSFHIGKRVPVAPAHAILTETRAGILGQDCSADSTLPRILLRMHISCAASAVMVKAAAPLQANGCDDLYTKHGSCSKPFEFQGAGWKYPVLQHALSTSERRPQKHT